ncbi:DUF4402 domain-containing protein [Labilibaculum sp. K2S]|uniref:DUF4402 domain-containing protein n=1 Tax=Labilibaculum sp. K2S TaxID=3056386 RepID=UPI0025A3D862|nr:DUF4402 domain-containing protein [Labilibaculum sp. K2S]MDM8161061.1 DUF4402 domain-containing protein [Labilibaculum sp. K2S]
MKNLTKVFAVAITMFGFATSSFAQANATASASATATIIAPIAIVKNTDMVFGNIVVQPLAAGQTVTLDAAAVANASHSPLVTLPNYGIVTPTAAEFTVTGATDYTYTLEYPATISLAGATGIDMSVALTCNVEKTAGVLAEGSETLYIGGTLSLGTDQVAEVYTTASDFDVTVNYN